MISDDHHQAEARALEGRAASISFADVEAAAARIRGYAHRTPTITSRTLDQLAGSRLFFKCENFQRAGAFKFRGAINALLRLRASINRGVLTFSSGNHAQAIALAGQILDIPTTIVMPEDAPVVKRAATTAYGGEVILYDRKTTSREELGQQIAAARELTVVPPFDHPDVIAGQGTAVRELIEEVGPLDVLVVPCGGGGLLSGSTLAARAMAPKCRVVGVEPEAGDDATRSFRTGVLQTVSNPDTIADGARTSSLGAFTFPIVVGQVDDMVTVSDAALVRAMHLLAERAKIVVEPTGALAAAAVFEGAVSAPGARVGVVISGGNVDLREWSALFGRQGATDKG